ncbi:catechol 2,3-dioxygenase-like lactoylglutathione lyase family enzyme [Sphingobium wenxiniae]|uniref:Catechol 2,3-dioxygenase-like lactoylglutathione lyase family enzyme n=1 Tax=Sphingobium wenxiniae (strain DSM 21828 / CGMCC 1.7748 / JZ-1) TaxID=595605 RepID=A0A562KGW9_SPHWJ|nr:VOC family protein [Sphingobium wenxiniae]MBB6190797.1 catechol 2,3-dioxygenase-like lactoylglutathione lyase family enzyme [Sphingobium wenxiniae]TWH94574.1 catechol 2,3-dioxygenase-like lactoylglutathione lyase family enzyme [Sphingobium wenxiniae]
MFSHITVGADDLEKSRTFYDAVLGSLGYGPGVAVKEDRYAYPSDKGLFLIVRPIDGQEASYANGGTIGFTCDSPEKVEAWHAAGVANGGTSIENPPGMREAPFGNLYLAYLRDPYGNKLCAMHRMTA